MQQPQTVFFVGKPGSGKGTQAALLAKRTGWPVFASGDLFRSLAQEDTPAGRKLREENYAGILQPPWFATYLYLQSLFSIPEGQSAIFDGFNRKIPEAELIVESLKWLGRPFTILLIDVSDEEVAKRIELRKKVSNRSDDHELIRRLEEYKKYTEDAIEIFRNAGVLTTVCGERPIDEIAADIRIALNLA